MQFAEIAKNARVLDCGCGGGANIRTMLKKCPNGEVKGVDYSPVSVEKAKKVNEDAILNGRCVILQGNVADLIFAANQFDLVTAFETIYFWPDLLQSFREVHRVLKPDGMFLICNECGGDNEKDEKWTEKIDGMTIYKDVQPQEHFGADRLPQYSNSQERKGLALHHGTKVRKQGQER